MKRKWLSRLRRPEAPPSVRGYPPTSVWSSNVLRNVLWLLEEEEDELGPLSDRYGVTGVNLAAPDPDEFIARFVKGQDEFGVTVGRTDSDPGAPSVLAGKSEAEVAFLLVFLGLLEPRELDDFAPPDADGVRWLALDEWAPALQ